MKTQTIITELNQEDLVNLFAVATYGSNWLTCYAPDKEGVDILEEDCYEDVLAKCLLAGKKIICTDYYAEGIHYGDNKEFTFGEEDEECAYQISLEDIIKGLQACMDGTFKHGNDGYGEREVEWLDECFCHLRDGGYDMDQPEAEALMQVIMFGELIYG